MDERSEISLSPFSLLHYQFALYFLRRNMKRTDHPAARSGWHVSPISTIQMPAATTAATVPVISSFLYLFPSQPLSASQPFSAGESETSWQARWKMPGQVTQRVEEMWEEIKFSFSCS
jgi:hypothetical protein